MAGLFVPSQLPGQAARVVARLTSGVVSTVVRQRPWLVVVEITHLVTRHRPDQPVTGPCHGRGCLDRRLIFLVRELHALGRDIYPSELRWGRPVARVAEIDLTTGELGSEEAGLAAGELAFAEADRATGELGAGEVDRATGELGAPEADRGAGELGMDEADHAAGAFDAAEADLATGELGAAEVDHAAGELGVLEVDFAAGELGADEADLA